MLDTMVECSKEDAIRARKIALKKLQNKDFSGARRIALQAQRLYPELENLSQLLTVCELYCAAQERINRQLDWYGILQVEVTADDTVIRKQYDKLVFWLHPNKNSLPGADAAFKLVSEAHTILCDHVKRSRYDIKRQGKQLPGATPANRNGVAGHVKPYDLTVVFWTICPHCQKRFVYYQRNFLVSCDDCGKNFFAFKLNEQAVPSSFLSAAPKNSQVSQEMFSCQHVFPDQLVKYSKLHATGGSIDSTHVDEPMKWGGSLDGFGEGSSKTRSNVVQCSAVNGTHSSSPSAGKGTTRSMMLESSDPDIAANQNLSREDASAVLNTAASCSLEGLSRRKQDDCTDSSHNRDSRNNKRKMMDNSLSDASNDTMSRSITVFSDNVTVTKNQSTEHFSRKMDNQEEENATHVGNEEKYKKETMQFTYQMYGKPEIDYKRPDFFDFVKLRDFKRIAVGQIWAVYDDNDLMPRVYAQINHVDASNLKVQLTWLEHNTMNELKSRCAYKELPVACGNFFLGDTYVLQDPSMYLSHRVYWTKGKNRFSFEIHPKKGEVWALYKESSMRWNSGADNHQPCNYDVVQVSGSLMNIGVIVYPLVRIEGFVSLFAKAKDKCHFLIPSGELFRFSHSIPCYITNGKEKAGVSKGFLELDTAALPCDFATAFSPININSLDKMSSELVAVTYPNSEFHNFDEDRSCEKFECGQIWALYNNTDTLPNLYGWLSKVETEPFKVHLTWLKACPQKNVEKFWLEQEIPMSCGYFEIGNSTAECHEKCAFSHIAATVQIGTECQVKILPKVGEVWAIYKNWSPDWVPSRNCHRAEYAIGEIIKCTEGGTLFAFLTKVGSHVSVFKPDARSSVLEILTEENRRFSHRIPSFRLTEENDGELRGFYELDPAAVPDVIW
ncbi:unnamed protein product [Urochloa decumbens]|uniref:J domain-containing protein n=1 Tax=Urochloa decumbens TaxID=240449 RepID=A0ABC9AII4_9POAL